MAETHDWVSTSYPWGERDVWFDDPGQKRMYRHDSKSDKFFSKVYGADTEREIRYDNKAMFEAECGDNRIITE